jgi:V-type H+-transporting ATPase subunit H
VVNELRGKELVMRLMMHPDPAVQREALGAVQKILLSRDKADFLAGGPAPVAGASGIGATA